MTSSEHTVADDERMKLDREIGRILLRIHRKWLQTGEGGDDWAKAPISLEEMETVIIPAESEAIQPFPPVDEELTETVILTPQGLGGQTVTSTGPVEEVPETVILTPDSHYETLQVDDVGSAVEETIILGSAGTHSGQPMQGEENLDETIILPPKKQRPKRKGVR